MRVVADLKSIIRTIRNSRATVVDIPAGTGAHLVIPGTISRLLSEDSNGILVSTANSRVARQTENFTFGLFQKSNVKYVALRYIRRVLLSIFFENSKYKIPEYLVLMESTDTDFVIVQLLWLYIRNHSKKRIRSKLPNLIIIRQGILKLYLPTTEYRQYEVKPEQNHTVTVDYVGYKKLEQLAPKFKGKTVVVVKSQGEAGRLERSFNRGKSGIKVEAIRYRTKVPEIRRLAQNRNKVLIIPEDIFNEVYIDDEIDVIIDMISTTIPGAERLTNRLGISQKGLSIRVYPEGSLHRSHVNNIVSEPIHLQVAEVINARQDPQEVFIRGFSGRANLSITLLERLGIVEDYVITAKGRFVSRLNFKVENSAILYEWVVKGGPVFPGLVLISLIEAYGSGYYNVPSGLTFDQKLKRARDVLGPSDDTYIQKTQMHTLLELFNHFVDQFSKDLYEIVTTGWLSFSKEISSWIRTYELYPEGWTKLLDTIGINYNAITAYRGFQDLDMEMGTYEPRNVMNKAYPFILDAYEDKICSNFRGNTYRNDQDANQLYTYDSSFPLGIVERQFSEKKIKTAMSQIVVLHTRPNKNNDGTITLCIPVSNIPTPSRASSSRAASSKETGRISSRR